MAKQEKELEFEAALKRLETIVAEMEGGALSLEAMLKHFEEGRKLVTLCSRKLNEVERRIEILVKKGDDVAAEPFGEPTDDAPESTKADDRKPLIDAERELF